MPDSLSQRLGRPAPRYWWLLGTEIISIAALAFPRAYLINSLSFSAVVVVLIWVLRTVDTVNTWQRWLDGLYQAMGVALLLSLWGCLVFPDRCSSASLAALVLWILFIGWALLRLLTRLAVPDRVRRSELAGATAGYLLLGLTGGLLLNGMMLLDPHSLSPLVSGMDNGALFSQLLHAPSGQGGADTDQLAYLWDVVALDVIYYGFVALTTLGLGDIVPLTPQAKLLSVGLSVMGTLYLAMVMGVLIARYTASLTAGDQLSDG